MWCIPTIPIGILGKAPAAFSFLRMIIDTRVCNNEHACTWAESMTSARFCGNPPDSVTHGNNRIVRKYDARVSRKYDDNWFHACHSIGESGHGAPTGEDTMLDITTYAAASVTVCGLTISTNAPGATAHAHVEGVGIDSYGRVTITVGDGLDIHTQLSAADFLVWMFDTMDAPAVVSAVGTAVWESRHGEGHTRRAIAEELRGV